MSFFWFDSVQKRKKCAVIGCHGLGGTIAYALAHSGLADSLVLIDQDKRLSRGQAADLCASLPFGTNLDVWSGEMSDLANSALIILALGSFPLHESAHADMVALNSPLIRQAVPHISAHAPDAVILVVSEPVDIMTYTATHYAGMPEKQIIGIGTLPYTHRLCRLIAQYLNISPDQVEAMILGQAGRRATVCWSAARVCGMPLLDYLTQVGRTHDTMILHSLFDDVINAFEHAENAKGAPDFSLANAVVSAADAVLNDKQLLLPLCTASDGFCDLSHVCMSVPCILGRHGAQVIESFIPAPAELEHLQKSAAALRSQLLDAQALFLQK